MKQQLSITLFNNQISEVAFTYLMNSGHLFYTMDMVDDFIIYINNNFPIPSIKDGYTATFSLDEAKADGDDFTITFNFPNFALVTTFSHLGYAIRTTPYIIF